MGFNRLRMMEKAVERVKITVKGDIQREYQKGVTPMDILQEISPSKKKAKDIVAARFNGALIDLTTPIADDGEISFVSVDSDEGMDIYRHSTSHVMAQAVKELYPDVRLGIGPSISDGFYYDFDLNDTFTPDDLVKIEERMQKIIEADRPFVRKVLSKEDAIRLFKERGETYKVELISDIEDYEVSLYEQDGFVDLCRGPHLPSTGWIKSFKLLSTAGAYWRGDEKNRMLQRIYGTSFPDSKALSTYLERLEEAKKRDHRRLGKELGLYSIYEEIGPGLILWHPKGARIRSIIEDFWKREHYRQGYNLVYTPHIARSDLWKTSGHWEFYRENLFSPMDVEGSEYIIKPMNCPFHIHIYKSRIRSYRDLPVRYAELGTVYRYERSGVLHGLLRVRGFTQDDAHIYCRQDQIEGEIKRVLELTMFILRTFGFDEFDIYLSTRPEKFVGSIEDWDRATGALRSALEASDFRYEIDPGEGVFYGPKIDIKIRDSLGRSWQCSTIQVDFNLPQRFQVEYVDKDNTHKQAIMIHRALMGSLERFFGCLIEHYAGAFPLWLAPVQVMILTISDKVDDYAVKIYNTLRGEDVRVELDNRNEKLGLKIREAQMAKVPYMVIIGEKEKDKGLLALRSRDKGQMGETSIEDFISLLKDEVKIPTRPLV